MPETHATGSKAERPDRDIRPIAVRVGDRTIAPGEKVALEIPIARLPPTRTTIALPVEIAHGIRPGPKIWLSAAIHGDELNGIEIVRRVLDKISPRELSGTVIGVPVVNVFGLINESRYLPDRRDLNRSFPGSARGPLASRVAHILVETIIRQCTHGIDLHTGSDHRRNLPQIRAQLTDPETRRCAEAFGAPVMIHAATRDGSLRDAASRLGISVLLYEGGETLRYDQDAIEVGVEGTRRVLVELGMIEGAPVRRSTTPFVATRTVWLRARTGGLCRKLVGLGDWVERREELAIIADSFGRTASVAFAPHAGYVIGTLENPVVHRGDALIHLAVEFEGKEDT